MFWQFNASLDKGVVLEVEEEEWLFRFKWKGLEDRPFERFDEYLPRLLLFGRDIDARLLLTSRFWDEETEIENSVGEQNKKGKKDFDTRVKMKIN